MALPTLLVMGNPSNTDKLATKILTGKYDYASDRLCGQKWYGALKGANISHGAIKLTSGGVVTAFTVTSAGSGYTSAPTVLITGGGGTGATATAVLSSTGTVASVTVVSGGSNYGVVPTVTFSGGGGSGAAATATISAGTPAIDATAALALPGVKAVITYVDVNANASAPIWSPNIIFFGQPVAGVIADDWYTAIRATTLINVQYNVAPFISDPDAAMQANAVLSGVYATTNLTPVPPGTFVRGDVNGATGFSAADVTLQTTTAGWTTTYQHNDLEPHQAVAWWNGPDCYVWCGSQAPFTFKSTLVNGLGIPANKVHFFTHGMGGGLGDRLAGPELVPAAVMSLKVNGHPVDLMETRKEQNLMQIRQAQNKGDIKWGAKKDGTIVAASGDWYGVGSGASGCYFGINNTYTIPNVSWSYQSVYTNAPARGAWRCVQDPPGAVLYDSALDKLAAYLNMDPWALRQKNLRAADQGAQDSPFRVWGGNGAPLCLNTVYTNSGYATKWHAPGAKTMPDGRLHGIAITGHLDSHASSTGVTRGGLVTMTTDGTALIDMGGGRTCYQPSTMCHFVAETLGMNYADVNIGDWGNTDTSLDGGSEGGSGFTGGAGSAFVSAALDLRAQLWAYAAGKAPFLGVTVPGVTKATATATVANGSVIAVTVTNGGSGYNGGIPALIGGVGFAGAGVPFVTFSGGNFTTSATGVQSVASGGQAVAVANVVNGVVTSITVTNGGSGYLTAPTVTISGFTANDLSAASSIVTLAASPPVTTTYKSIMSGSNPTLGRGNGWAWALRSHAVGNFPIGSLSNSNGSCASCTELLVDPETGQVEILGHWNAVDTGRTVFYQGAMGQILGGSELQVYQCLYAGDVYDPTTGAVISDNYTESQLETCADLYEERFNGYPVEQDDAACPFGAHGIAEPTLSNYASIYNAIFNATGKWVDPAQGACTPNKVLKALGLA